MTDGRTATSPAVLWIAPLALGALCPVTIELPSSSIAGLAFAPPALLAALVVALVRPREPLPLLVALFLWGAAVAAAVSQTMNDTLVAWIAAQGSESAARAIAPMLVGPLVEESAKALGLVLLLATGGVRLRGVREGVTCGALVGFGFAAAENVGYHLLAVVQGGSGGLARAVFVRGILEGFNHATFTAAIGAGIGLARATPRAPWRAFSVPLGVAAALVEHGAWNGVASQAITDLLCGAATEGGACRATPPAEALLLGVPAVVAAFVGPGLVALIWLTRRTG
jgi:RsiW-degrading membrane proteinase PrsW (M82 family)